MRFWEELQSLDEPTKNKIIVIATVAVMIIIIYLWLAYFNALVVGGTAQNNQPAQGVSGGAVQGVGSWFGSIAGWFADAWRGLTGIFQSPQQYLIQPQR